MKTPWLGEESVQEVQLDQTAVRPGGRASCRGGVGGVRVLGEGFGAGSPSGVAALRAVLGFEALSVAVRGVVRGGGRPLRVDGVGLGLGLWLLHRF